MSWMHDLPQQKGIAPLFLDDIVHLLAPIQVVIDETHARAAQLKYNAIRPHHLPTRL